MSTEQKTETTPKRDPRTDVFHIEPGRINVRPGFNVRTDYPKDKGQELEASIEQFGVKEPLTVSRDKENPGFFLVNASGHNRLFYSKKLILEGRGEKVQTIPVIIERSFDELDATVRILSSNSHVPLSLYEKGIAFVRIEKLLAEKTGGKVKISEICVAAGLPKNAQTNTMVGSALRLVKLADESEYMAKTLGKRKISETQVLDMIRKGADVEAIEKKTERAIEKAKESGRETATGKDTGATVTPLQKLASAIEGLEEAGHSGPRLNSAKAILEALSLKKGCTIEVLMKAISPSVEFEGEKKKI